MLKIYIIGTIKIDSKFSDRIAFEAFYLELCKLWGLAISVTETMDRQLFEKRYDKKWDKYSERVISIHEIFNDSKNLIFALKKLEEKREVNDDKPLAIVDGNKATLTYKERGRKRLLAAWLTRCYNKGFITAKYDYTTCSKVVLAYFGFDVKGDNDVRDFLGSNIPNKYYDLIGSWN